MLLETAGQNADLLICVILFVGVLHLPMDSSLSESIYMLCDTVVMLL